MYDALDAGDAPRSILNEDMLPAICGVFENYHRKAVSLSQLLASVEALKKGIDALKPFLPEDCMSPYGRYRLAVFSSEYAELAGDFISLLRDCLGPGHFQGKPGISVRQGSHRSVSVRPHPKLCRPAVHGV